MPSPSTLHSRLFIVAGILLIVPLSIGIQLARLHFSAGEGLRALWKQQAIEMQDIPAQRGAIYDVNGRLLATNTAAYKVAIDPGFKSYTTKVADTVSYILSEVTGLNANSYKKRIADAKKNKSRYVVLEKKLPHSAYMALKGLGERSVILEKQFTRAYTFNELGAHVLGYVNFNMDGMIGLESQFNKELKGKPGKQQVRKSRLNKSFEYIGAPKVLPVNGHNIYTTLDVDIQSIAETELRRGIEKTRAKSGVVIVLDVKSGAVRSMVSWPTFDPNRPATTSEENRRNYAISDMMEPGSTFKLVTAVAALNEGVLKKGEIFETPENGRSSVYGLALVDHDPLGNLRFDEVIAKSSNIATAEIASRVPKNHFYQYARNLGFGMKTDIELPGESTGLLKKPMEWTQVTQPFMSIGYEMLATPLQIAQAYAAFANNGVLMKPYIVDKIVDEYGNVEKQFEATKVREAIDKKVVAELVPIFKQVVSDSGTASWAQIEGLSVAGKTGTAKMVKNGRYTAAYRASFAGFFPAEAPEYVCYVMLEEPKTSIYGGYASGPIFRRIAERIAAHEGFEKNWLVDARPEIAFYGRIPNPKWKGRSSAEVSAIGEAYDLDVDIDNDKSGIFAFVTDKNNADNEIDSIHVADEIELTSTVFIPTEDENSLVDIPDVRGMSMRQASRALLAVGLKPSFNRSGTVYSQFPLPGQKLRKGKIVAIRGKAISMVELSSTAVGGSKK
jgi:cell division protein FtsI (penicillin-binding protein 3)